MVNYHIGMTLDKLEKEAIKYTYKFYENNKSQTARALGITAKTLDSKLKIYEEEDKEVLDAKKREELIKSAVRKNPLADTMLAEGAVKIETTKADSGD